jgi:allantoate deiminase
MPTPLETALSRLDHLAEISDSPNHLVRTFLSPASHRAALAIRAWMTDLGMETAHSLDGTLRGVLPGKNPDAAPLLMGSHYDTVIDAGKYDGPLGIVSALAALEVLRQENVILPFPVHVLAFSEEEGIRFQTTYLGSRSIVGKFDNTTLAIRDGNGITLAAALEDSGWADGATTIRYPKGRCRGYIELHIEQGRVLEHAKQPACVVSGISGQLRLNVTVDGQADHAGTTPMNMRRDALAGAAECILAAEALARSQPPLVITVGKIQVHPGASNSIPQRCTFTIDLRHPDDTSRREATENLHEAFTRIANLRDLGLGWQPVQENDATPCDSQLTAKLLKSLTGITGSGMSLPSGAGHDGVVVSEICPIAMLFIRCREGLSHHPDEFASPGDIGIGIDILTHFLKSIPA